MRDVRSARVGVEGRPGLHTFNGVSKGGNGLLHKEKAANAVAYSFQCPSLAQSDHWGTCRLGLARSYSKILDAWEKKRPTGLELLANKVV